MAQQENVDEQCEKMFLAAGLQPATPAQLENWLAAQCQQDGVPNNYNGKVEILLYFEDIGKIGVAQPGETTVYFLPAPQLNGQPFC